MDLSSYERAPFIDPRAYWAPRATLLEWITERLRGASRAIRSIKVLTAMAAAASESGLSRDKITILANICRGIPGATLTERFRALADCACCVRHNLNKPKTIAPFDVARVVETPEGMSRLCECECRDKAQMFCHIWFASAEELTPSECSSSPEPLPVESADAEVINDYGDYWTEVCEALARGRKN